MLQVDLVCCLTSKHEKPQGGAGSLSEVYVADGTGFALATAGGEWDDRRDAALLKGIRAALGKPGWSPGNPRPPPVPAHLKVEILENSKEVGGGRPSPFFFFCWRERYGAIKRTRVCGEGGSGCEGGTVGLKVCGGRSPRVCSRRMVPYRTPVLIAKIKLPTFPVSRLPALFRKQGDRLPPRCCCPLQNLWILPVQRVQPAFGEIRYVQNPPPLCLAALGRHGNQPPRH